MHVIGIVALVYVTLSLVWFWLGLYLDWHYTTLFLPLTWTAMLALWVRDGLVWIKEWWKREWRGQ